MDGSIYRQKYFQQAKYSAWKSCFLNLFKIYIIEKDEKDNYKVIFLLYLLNAPYSIEGK